MVNPKDGKCKKGRSVMNELQKMEQERSVLRWGGLSGMLGVIFFLVAIVAAMVFVGDDPPTLAETVIRFPEVKMFRVVENLSYLMGLVLQVPLFLALYLALRKTSLAPALFGSALGILGLGALVVSTTPHVAHARLADLYNAPGATPVGSGNNRPHVAVSLGHDRNDGLHWLLCDTARHLSPRRGHARRPGLWQRLWLVEHGAWRNWIRRGLVPDG